MAVESWQAVARALGARMAYQADNCPAGRDALESGGYGVVANPALVHRIPDDHADDCPFCADTVAYRRFLARQAGRPYRPERPARD